ncbi:MAG: lytic transglycosylase domain-containing protein [Fibrobacter sp.]|nr:lytic transglycosylase domain-containing protein [Fibrobacter sp.]
MNRILAVLRRGFLIYGKNVWFSELTSILFVIILSASLAIITSIIFHNEIIAHRDDNTLVELRKENLIRQKEHDHLSNVIQISETLRSVLNNRITDQSIFRLSELIYSNSRQYSFDPLLLIAVIQVESFFNEKALGRFRSGNLSGAIGLMQLKIETAQEMAKKLGLQELTMEDLLKPEINIMIGVSYLTFLINKFRSFKLGLLAYNQGPGTVTLSLKSNQLSVRYYQKVLKAYYQLKQVASSK